MKISAIDFKTVLCLLVFNLVCANSTALAWSKPGSESEPKQIQSSYYCSQTDSYLKNSEIFDLAFRFNSSDQRIIGHINFMAPFKTHPFNPAPKEVSSLGIFSLLPDPSITVEQHWKVYSPYIKNVASQLFRKDPTYAKYNMIFMPPKFKPNSNIYALSSPIELGEDGKPLGLKKELLNGASEKYQVYIVIGNKELNEGDNTLELQLYFRYDSVKKDIRKNIDNYFEMTCFKQKNEEKEPAAKKSTVSNEITDSQILTDDNNTDFKPDDIIDTSGGNNSDSNGLNFLTPKDVTHFLAFWMTLTKTEQSDLLELNTKTMNLSYYKTTALAGGVSLAAVWAAIKMVSKKHAVIALASVATTAKAIPENNQCIGPKLITNLIGLSSEDFINCLNAFPALKKEFLHLKKLSYQ